MVLKKITLENCIITFIIIILIFLLSLSFYLFIHNENSSEIFINNENITLNGDTLYYNKKLEIVCDKCYLNGTEITKTTINKEGDYDLEYKSNHIYLKLSFNGINIYDYYNNEIHNYDTNILPFIIKSSASLLVNGEEYNQERLYNYGEYNITNNQKSIKVKINRSFNIISEKDIYLTAGTLSSLYASLLMSSKENLSNTFIWCGRSTFDNNYLKKLNITVSKYTGSSDNYDKLFDEVKEYIYTSLKEEPNTHFNIYTNEVDFSFVLSTFGELGLLNDKFSVNIITDGTISYSMDYSYLNNNSYIFYSNYEKSLNDKIEQIYKGNLKGDKVSDKEYIIPYLVDNYVTYYLQYPKYLISEDEKVNKEIKKINYNSITLNDLYNGLKDEQKEIFFNIIRFNKEEFDKNYFSDNSKPYLIITGNVPMDYGYGRDNFNKTIKYIVKKYKDKYIILFKPHPRAEPDEEYTKLFDELNIKILPSQMPMEAISFVYDVYLGGFPSSLYMSSEDDKVLFLFAKNKDDMFEPLPEMVNDTFKNVEIINPRKVDEI